MWSPCVQGERGVWSPHTQRFDSDKAGDREVQRTMLELLSQMDGFTASDNIKVRLFLLPCFLSPTWFTHATGYCRNEPRGHSGPCPPALWSSRPQDRVPAAQRGRPRPHHADPQPQDERPVRLVAIANPSSDVNFQELARCTEDFNGAQLKAVCVEAVRLCLQYLCVHTQGMIALRREANDLTHEDFMEGSTLPHCVTSRYHRGHGEEEEGPPVLLVVVAGSGLAVASLAEGTAMRWSSWFMIKVTYHFTELQ